ncbi:MAG: tetratricopeptide repeat protein, partial [Planctomycetota bacterium JB042]
MKISSSDVARPLLLAGVVLLTLLPGCGGLAPHARTDSPVADERLSALLASHRAVAAHGAGVVIEEEEVIVDSGRIRNEIERLTLEFPDHVPSLMASAQLAHDAGETTKAVSYLDRVRRLEPGHADAVVLRARIALEEGSIPLARRLVEEQIDRTPDHSSLREVEAGVRFLAGEHEAALRSLDVAESLGAPRARVLYLRGLIEAARRLPVAAALLDQAAEVEDPGARGAERLGDVER